MKYQVYNFDHVHNWIHDTFSYKVNMMLIITLTCQNQFF